MTILDYVREKGWERYVVQDEEGNDYRSLKSEVAQVIAEFSHMTVLRLKDQTRVQVQKLVRF